MSPDSSTGTLTKRPTNWELRSSGSKTPGSLDGRVTRSGQTEFGPDGRGAGLNIVQSGHDISITSWRTDGMDYDDAKLLITRLPNRPGLKASSVTVGKSSTNENSIKVVLNKEAKTWGNMTDEMDVQLPALITKDASVIQAQVENRDAQPKTLGRT